MKIYMRSLSAKLNVWGIATWGILRAFTKVNAQILEKRAIIATPRVYFLRCQEL